MGSHSATKSRRVARHSAAPSALLLPRDCWPPHGHCWGTGADGVPAGPQGRVSARESPGPNRHHLQLLLLPGGLCLFPPLLLLHLRGQGIAHEQAPLGWALAQGPCCPTALRPGPVPDCDPPAPPREASWCEEGLGSALGRRASVRAQPALDGRHTGARVKYSVRGSDACDRPAWAGALLGG